MTQNEAKSSATNENDIDIVESQSRKKKSKAVVVGAYLNKCISCREKNDNENESKTNKLTYVRQFFINFSINPFNSFYYIWLIITSIFYLYNSIFLIARSSFWLLQELNDDYFYAWFIIDYSNDLVYLLDMVVRLTTGFMQNGELCLEKRLIAKQYINSFQFKIDLMSILPTDLIYLALKRSNLTYRLLPAMRFNRLLRFDRLIEFRYLTETQTKYPTIFRMSNLLLNILIAMHWNACIYFVISDLIGFGSDTWVFPALTSELEIRNLTERQKNNLLLTHHLDVQYIYCFWWGVQTFTTIAEVPPPKTYYQEMYMSLLLMIGVVILGITIGSASDMVENANRRNIELQMRCDDAKSFLIQNKITGELETRIKNYLDYLWITSETSSSDDVLNRLPDNLRKEIAKNVHIETLKRVHVFQDCEPNLLGELVTKLKLEVYSPGDYVCRKGDVGHEMYFIKTGKLQVVSPDGTKVFATMSAGAAFGEISILDIPGNKNGNKRTANIRSLGFSDVYQLSKNDLWTALSEYPMAKKSLLEKGKALLKKDNLIDDELAHRTEQKLKPIHEQVEYFQKNNLSKLNAKCESTIKKYIALLRETKKELAIIENSF